MNTFTEYILSFSFFAFLGWTMETLYATQKQEEFVNRGFLYGPFCPIYGFGGLLVKQAFLQMDQWTNHAPNSVLGSILLSILLVTLLEYATGSVLEKIFDKKWWDYSDEPFNLHGYICLKFSILWGLVAFVFMQVVAPIHFHLLAQIPMAHQETLALILIAYFLSDTAKTLADLVDLRHVIFHHTEYSFESYRQKIKEHRRFFQAFPSLCQLNSHVKNREIRKFFGKKLDQLKIEFKNRRI